MISLQLIIMKQNCRKLGEPVLSGASPGVKKLAKENSP
jgi:hypothetical protein